MSEDGLRHGFKLHLRGCAVRRRIVAGYLQVTFWHFRAAPITMCGGVSNSRFPPRPPFSPPGDPPDGPKRPPCLEPQLGPHGMTWLPPSPSPLLAPRSRAKTSTAADSGPDPGADRGFHGQVNSWLLSPSPWISPSAKVDCCVSENKFPPVAVHGCRMIRIRIR